MYKEYKLRSLGEQVAIKTLKDADYKIVTQNYRTREGEIDIIAFNENTLVFIEVKTRSNVLFERPLEALSPFELKMMEKIVIFYPKI